MFNNFLQTSESPFSPRSGTFGKTRSQFPPEVLSVKHVRPSSTEGNATCPKENGPLGGAS